MDDNSPTITNHQSRHSITNEEFKVDINHFPKLSIGSYSSTIRSKISEFGYTNNHHHKKPSKHQKQKQSIHEAFVSIKVDNNYHWKRNSKLMDDIFYYSSSDRRTHTHQKSGSMDDLSVQLETIDKKSFHSKRRSMDTNDFDSNVHHATSKPPVIKPKINHISSVSGNVPLSKSNDDEIHYRSFSNEVQSNNILHEEKESLDHMSKIEEYIDGTVDGLLHGPIIDRASNVSSTIINITNEYDDDEDNKGYISTDTENSMDNEQQSAGHYANQTMVEHDIENIVNEIDTESESDSFCSPNIYHKQSIIQPSFYNISQSSDDRGRGHDRRVSRSMLHAYYRSCRCDEDRWFKLAKRVARHWKEDERVIIHMKEYCEEEEYTFEGILDDIGDYEDFNQSNIIKNLQTTLHWNIGTTIRFFRILRRLLISRQSTIHDLPKINFNFHQPSSSISDLPSISATESPGLQVVSQEYAADDMLWEFPRRISPELYAENLWRTIEQELKSKEWNHAVISALRRICHKEDIVLDTLRDDIDQYEEEGSVLLPIISPLFNWSKEKEDQFVCDLRHALASDQQHVAHKSRKFSDLPMMFITDNINDMQSITINKKHQSSEHSFLDISQIASPIVKSEYLPPSYDNIDIIGHIPPSFVKSPSLVLFEDVCRKLSVELFIDSKVESKDEDEHALQFPQREKYAKNPRNENIDNINVANYSLKKKKSHMNHVFTVSEERTMFTEEQTAKCLVHTCNTAYYFINNMFSNGFSIDIIIDHKMDENHS